MGRIEEITGDAEPDPVNILIQDPHTLVRDCLRLVVERLGGARVIGEASSLSEVLDKAREMAPDIIVLDFAEFDVAAATLSSITRELPDTRVICLAEGLSKHAIDAVFGSGGSGFVLKSEPAEDLVRALEQVRSGSPAISRRAAAPVVRDYLEAVRKNSDRDDAIIEALACAVEAKDRATAGHCKRVTTLAGRIAAALDPALGVNRQLQYGFKLHDIGKIGIPEEILFKAGSLNAEEWEVMRTHPTLGNQIISPVGLGDEVTDVILHHHEKWDGSGYPAGLAGEDIPLGARIFAVADAFDAMTSDRPYRRATPTEQAKAEIQLKAGGQFDPEAVEAFLALA